MIIKTNIDGFKVVVDDDRGVICEDPETRTMLQGLIDAARSMYDPASPAGYVGDILRDQGHDLTITGDGKIH